MSCLRRIRGGSDDRQGERERGTVPHFRPYTDLATMSFHDVFDDGKSQTSTPRGGGWHLDKLVEDTRQIVCWDATAGIGHGDGDVTIACGCGHGNLTTALGMPYGIAHEVGDDALYVQTISTHDRQYGRHVDSERALVGFHLRAHRGDGRVHERGGADGDHVGRVLAFP